MVLILAEIKLVKVELAGMGAETMEGDDRAMASG